MSARELAESGAVGAYLLNRALKAPEVERPAVLNRARAVAILARRPELRTVLPAIAQHPRAAEILSRL